MNPASRRYSRRQKTLINNKISLFVLNCCLEMLILNLKWQIMLKSRKIPMKREKKIALVPRSHNLRIKSEIRDGLSLMKSVTKQ